MHNQNGKNDSWGLWLMMIICSAPLVLIIIFGLAGKSFGAPTWILIGGLGLVLIIHFFSMFRSRKNQDEGQMTTEGEDKNKDGQDHKNHSGHGCCH